MTRKPRGLTGQMEQLIESALMPGCFISYNADFDFIGGLEAAEKQIAGLVPTAPEVAGSLYETFLAGCYEPRASGAPRGCASSRRRRASITTRRSRTSSAHAAATRRPGASPIGIAS